MTNSRQNLAKKRDVFLLNSGIDHTIIKEILLAAM